MGRGDDKGKVEGVGGEKVESALEKIQKLREADEAQFSSVKETSEAFKKPAEDVFKKSGVIPQFLKAVQQRLESSRVFQSFKLPGSGYIVHDKRDETRSSESAKTEEKHQAHASGLQLKDGKLQKIRERVYENYLGDKSQSSPQQQQISGEGAVKKPMTAFEKMILERFEKGLKIAKESEDGKPHFFEKSDSEWKAFFKKFIPRTFWRKAELQNVRELIFRGLMSLKSGQNKYLVSDLIMKNGQLEKFVRFQILAEKLGLLPKMQPGSSLTSAQISQLIEGGFIKYLALVSKHKGKEIQTGKQISKGLFVSKQTEERIAEHLGISLGSSDITLKPEVKRVKKHQGILGGMFGGKEDIGEERSDKFIPWYSLEREERYGLKRWFVPLTLIVILVVLAIVGVILIKHLF